MKIAFLLPSLYMNREIYPRNIFAPGYLAKWMVNELVKRGNKVGFFTTSDVKTKAKLIAGDESYFVERLRKKRMSPVKFQTIYPKGHRYMYNAYQLELTMKSYKALRSSEYDLVHVFHDHYSHYFAELFKDKPTVFTLHDPLPKSGSFARFWMREFKDHNYVTISKAQRKGWPELNFIGNVYNGLRIEKYHFSGDPGKYLAFMGRFIPIKGVHTAIKVAKKVGIRLELAGSTFGNAKTPYWQKEIKPQIDGKRVIRRIYIRGPEKKSNFLGQAKALLFPIDWEEPFGMVMIEAMACGTPVIAFRRGSVPEVVKDGVTGFVVDTVAEMAAAVKKIDQIDRRACRKHVEENFTIDKMVDGYAAIYKKLLRKAKK